MGDGGSEPEEVVLSNDAEWQQLGQFWVRVLAALLRAPAFALFIGLHWLLDHVLGLVVPEGMARALTVARIAIFLVFLCVYVQLGIEVLAVFLPGIRPKALSFQIGGIKVEIGDGSGTKK